MDKKRRDVEQCLQTLRRTRKRRPLMRAYSARTGKIRKGVGRQVETAKDLWSQFDHELTLLQRYESFLK